MLRLAGRASYRCRPSVKASIGDTRTSIDVMGIFQRLNRESGITIVLITHEPDVAAYADRIVRFRDGSIQDDSPVAQPRMAGESVEEVLAI